MNGLMLATTSKTMSSLEIAQLTGKEHRNVMRDIRTMLVELHGEGGVLSFEQTNINPQNNQSYPCYALPKRETLILISGYSIAMRAKIIDRWQELEGQRPPTRLEMAHMLVEAETRCVEMAEKLAIAAPKVDHYDAVVDRTNLLNSTQIAQKLKMSAIHLNTILDGLAVYNKSVKRSRVFQQWFLDKGYGLIRQTEQGYSQPMFTLKGEAWIIQKLVSEGVATI